MRRASLRGILGLWPRSSLRLAVIANTHHSMDHTSDTRAVLDYTADECVVAPPADPSPTALTGADPALVKLLRKLEVCDSVDDADARRGFVAKHAKGFGLSVAVVLARLRVAGALSAEEVRGDRLRGARCEVGGRRREVRSERWEVRGER